MRTILILSAVLTAALYSPALAEEEIDSVSAVVIESQHMPVKQAALAALNGDGRRNAMLVLGFLALQDETLDEAMRWFGKLRVIDPADPEPAFLTALTQTWAGSNEDALKTLRTIREPEKLPRRLVTLQHIQRTQRELGEKADGPLRCVLDYFAWYEKGPAPDGAGPLRKDCGG